MPPQADEVVSLVVEHGPGQQPAHGLTTEDDAVQVRMSPALGQPLGQPLAGIEVKLVDLLPALPGDYA
jgi:hypothetical protein